jgi:hypothetical protein
MGHILLLLKAHLAGMVATQAQFGLYEIGRRAEVKIEIGRGDTQDLAAHF